MKRRWINSLIFISAIVSGVVYCLYLRLHNVEFFKVIYKGLLNNYEQKVSIDIIVSLLLGYVKKLCLLFILSSFSFLVPIGFAMMFVIIFSYSFTISCFIVLYGLKGACASFLLYGFQSIGMILISFYILNYKRKEKVQIQEKIGSLSKIYKIGIMFASLSVIVVLDVIVILNFNLIKQVLL